MSIQNYVYRGWIIDYSEQRPTTGKWVASSLGITMCAGNEELLKRIIDQRIKDYPGDGHGNSKRIL